MKQFSVLLLLCLAAAVHAEALPDEDNVLSPRFMELQFEATPVPAAAPLVPAAQPPAAKPVAAAPQPQAEKPAEGTLSIAVKDDKKKTDAVTKKDDKKAVKKTTPKKETPKKKDDKKKEDKKTAPKKPKTKTPAEVIVDAQQKVAAGFKKVKRIKHEIAQLKSKLNKSRKRLDGVHTKLAESDGKLAASKSLFDQATKSKEAAYKEVRNFTVAFAVAKEKFVDARNAKEEASNHFHKLSFQVKYHESKRNSFQKQKDAANVKSEEKKLDAIKKSLETATKTLEAAKKKLKEAREAKRAAHRQVEKARGVAKLHSKIVDHTEKSQRRARAGLLTGKVEKEYLEKKIAGFEAELQKKNTALVNALLELKTARNALKALQPKKAKKAPAKKTVSSTGISADAPPVAERSAPAPAPTPAAAEVPAAAKPAPVVGLRAAQAVVRAQPTEVDFESIA